MSSSNQPPKTKFQPGDYVYWGSTRYKVEEVVKIDRGWVYNLGSTSGVTNISIEDGDKYLSKA